MFGTVSGRPTLVAEALTITSPALSRSGSTALVSPENVGPTTPRICSSGMYLSFCPGAWAGSPWVSNSFSVYVYLVLAALASASATLAPSRMLIPRLAFGPVSGPTKANATVVLAAPPAAVDPDAESSSSSPQAAARIASAATGARTRSHFLIRSPDRTVPRPDRVASRSVRSDHDTRRERPVTEQ